MIVRICLFLILALLILIYVWFKWNFNYWSKHKSVPSVEGRIFSDKFWNVLTMKSNFYARLKEIYKDPKFQNEAAVGIYGAHVPGLLIRDLELIKQILIKDFDHFHERYVLTSAEHDPIGYHMLFFAPYSVWRELRLKFTPLFSSAKLKKFYSSIQDICGILEQHLDTMGERSEQDIWHLSSCYIIDVMANFVGVTSSCLTNPHGLFQNSVLELGKYNLLRVLNYMIIFFIPRLSSLLRVRVVPTRLETILKSYYESALKEREQSSFTRNDVVDMCLQHKKDFKGTEEEKKYFANCLISMEIILMMAGVETTMATVSYTLYEIAKQPEIQHKLRSQLLQLLRQTNGDLDWESVNKWEYLECVVKETLRIYPSLPVVERQYRKINSENYTLKPYYDFNIPDGMPIYITIAGLNSDPKLWPNPSQYDPDRFSAQNMSTNKSMAFIPFGDGPRNCIGSRLGMMMIKTFFVYFLRNHYVRVCDRTNTKIEFNLNATTLQPICGIHLEIVKDDLYAKQRKENVK